MPLAAVPLPTPEPIETPELPEAPLLRIPAFVSHVVAVGEWDAAIAEFDDVCQEQLASFAQARWPGVVLEPRLFLRGKEVIGGCLVMLQPLPFRFGTIAVVKWGPMLRFSHRHDAAANHALMVDALCDEYAERRGLMLSILPHAALAERNAAHEYLRHRGFRDGTALLFPNRYVVNLRLTDAEQRKSFGQKWRYHLNRAEKAGLSFEHAAPERLRDFTALYEQMVDRKKFPDHSAFGTLRTLMQLPEALRPELFFVRHESRIVAGAVIFKAGDRAVYLYGATSDDALELRAGYFLHWHIIGWLRYHTRARWYDLGGTDGFQGLHQFKKGMVGERGMVVPVPPVSNFATRRWARILGEGAFNARDLVHKAGRLLDRLRPDRAKPDQSRDRAGQ